MFQSIGDVKDTCRSSPDQNDQKRAHDDWINEFKETG